MLRIEAGLLLLDADFDSSRFAWNDSHRSTPIELGWGWMFKDLKSDDRAFIGRKALEREIADKTSRWRDVAASIVDWKDYDRVYNDGRPDPAQGPHAGPRGLDALRRRLRAQVGYATSFMYSPMLQRHIAIARVRPDLAATGTR